VSLIVLSHLFLIDHALLLAPAFAFSLVVFDVTMFLSLVANTDGHMLVLATSESIFTILW